jgi:glutaredoxin
MWLKLFRFFISVLLFLHLGAMSAHAAEKVVNLYFFYSDGCPHCSKEKEFFNDQSVLFSDVTIHAFEVTNPENAELFAAIGRELGINTNGVPVTIISDWSTVGFGSEQTTGKDILAAVARARQVGDKNLVGSFINPTQEIPQTNPDSNLNQEEFQDNVESDPSPSPIPQNSEDIPTPQVVASDQEVSSITLPVFGEIDIKSVSLPLITIAIAAVDGFNPCAMWVLLFLISMLLGMKNRTKMWILGTVFIATSGVMYFIFLAAWLNLFLFIGLIASIRLAIGLFALVAGSLQLKSYFTDKTGGCTVVSSSRRQRIFDRIRSITHGKYFIVSVIGIMALAVSVNLIELVCSAGLPALYTQLLALNQLPTWQYYAYLLLYTLIFMLDDLIIFAIAMISLEAIGIQGKYARISKLIGGTIILLIGLLMIFKPEWLMFG